MNPDYALDIREKGETVMNDQLEPRLLDVGKTKAYLGDVSSQTYYRLINSGAIASIKIGRRRFVEKSEIDRYLDEQRDLQN